MEFYPFGGIWGPILQRILGGNPDALERERKDWPGWAIALILIVFLGGVGGGLWWLATL